MVSLALPETVAVFGVLSQVLAAAAVLREDMDSTSEGMSDDGDVELEDWAIIGILVFTLDIHFMVP